jgi:hypothetical protein
MKEELESKTDDISALGTRPMTQLATGRSTATRDINSIMSVTLGVLAIVILVSYSVRATAPYVVGQNLVLAEIYLPGFYIKPITLFTYFFFLSFAFGLSSRTSKARFVRMDERLFEGLYVLAWFFVMMSGFEVIYQIVLWSAGLSVQGLQNPDIIVNWWPLNPYAINVVFAAKLVVLVFAMSCFSVDYLRRLRSVRERIGTSSAQF